MKRKRGRQKKEEGMVKSKRIIIRLSDDEYVKFRNAADDLGISMSSLMRDATVFQLFSMNILIRHVCTKNNNVCTKNNNVCTKNELMYIQKRCLNV